MSRTKRYIQRKAIERIPNPALDAVGKAVLVAVDKAVEDRWERAVRVAEEAEGDTFDERLRSINKTFRRELSAMGAASGAVAAAPGLGTAAAASALAADLGWFAMRATDLIMTVGAVHGHTESTAEERRAWVLSVLAFGEDAANQFSALLADIDAGSLVGGERVSARLAGLAGGDAAKLDALRRINASLATSVVTKYGSRRSIVAVGKLLPFGIGAIIGGTANYGLIRVVGSQADRFFFEYRGLLPPPPQPGQPSLSGPGAAPGDRLLTERISEGELVIPSFTGDTPDGGPPPPAPGTRRLPNPLTKLSKSQRRNSIPTDGRQR